MLVAGPVSMAMPLGGGRPASTRCDMCALRKGRTMDTGLLVLRVAVGLLLAGHGVQKLFGWCGGGGLAAATWFFRSVGYRPPRLMAGLSGGAELFGGAALAAGLGIPLAAAAVIATMLNAAAAAHTRNRLFHIDGGYGYPLGMGMAAATLGFTGAGTASLDAVLGHGDGSLEAGLFTLAMGTLTGCFVLLGRDTPDPGPTRCQRGSHETGRPPDIGGTHQPPVTSSTRRAEIA
jgi:putative oxidoreductase